MTRSTSTKTLTEKLAEQNVGSFHEYARQPAGPQAGILALQSAAGNGAISQLLRGEGKRPRAKGLSYTPAPLIQRQSMAAERTCPVCGRQGKGRCPGCGQALVSQQNSGTPGKLTINSNLSRVQAVLKSGKGRPLDPAMRTFMESRFAQDFGQVRVFQDAQAAASARAVNARAYTVGHDIVFGAQQYAPNTHRGLRLLSHELAHVVQQASNVSASTPGLEIAPSGTAAEREADASARAMLNSNTAVVTPGMRTSMQIARHEGETTTSEGTISVSRVDIYISSGKIDFHTSEGLFRYDLDQRGLSEGDYTATVAVTGNDVDFTLEGMEGAFEFSYRIRPGQPNPSTFFATQSTVPFHITRESAPPLVTPPRHEPESRTADVVTLTPEEALRRCEANDLPGVKVFPFRGTRFGSAPIMAHRDGEDIVVRQPVYVLANDGFREQTRTLPTETFIGGVRLRPNEIVRVHTYEPRWYHLNITGSTEGDIEQEFCVTGEQMLEIAEASTTATLVNIGLTAVDAATLFIPVGRVAGAVGRPLLRGGRTLTAAAMIGTAEAAPTALGGVASRAAVTVVEEQVVTRVAGRAMSQTVSHAVVETAERGVTAAAPRAATAAVPRFAAGGAASIAGTGALVSGAEVTGGAIRSTVTPGGGGGPTVAPPSPHAPGPTPPAPGPTSGVMLTTVTGEQVIVDANIAIALDKAARGLPLQPGEQLMVEAARRHGIVVTERGIEELARGGGAQATTRLAREVTATAAERQAIMTELERHAVGGGTPDREVVMQALLSETAPGITPTLATADRRMINGLWRAAGMDPRGLGRYRTVAEFLLYERGTNTFEVVIAGRQLIVWPIQAIRGGL